MSDTADRIEHFQRRALTAESEVRRLQHENAALREECAEGAATSNGWAEEAKGLHADLNRLHRELKALVDATGSAFPYVQARSLRSVLEAKNG